MTKAKQREDQVDYFNLDVIISVGYRVESHRGTQLRIWATQRLRAALRAAWSSYEAGNDIGVRCARVP